MRNLICILCCVILCFSCKQQADRKAENDPGNSANKLVMCAPEVIDKLWYSSGKKAPLLNGLEGINFPISTNISEAQKYFDQGLMLSFGFNHAEAARSFYEAARQDPSCAMCWWGYAYVLGPNYNAGMEKDNFKRAFDAVQKANKLSANCTQKEKDLIEALMHRYTNDTTIARPVMDSSYASAMRKVHNKYGNDATVISLLAEALMDLHPWNLYNKDGSPQPWTPEILALLENCLKMAPRHAGANHFYIHATEMSQNAERAMASADLLMDLVPGAGHLVHMPSHTYIRTGRYHDGVVSNQKAVLVDSLYLDACHAQGVYPLAYYPHNYHFIAACATLSGESKIALKGAKATADHAHKKLLRDPAWATLQHYYSIPWFVKVKLGLWNEICLDPVPEKELKYPVIIWHYANGMADLAQNNISNANKHLGQIKEIMKDTTIKELTIWGINSVYDICSIASKTLEGEIRAKEKNYKMATALLLEAVTLEDALNYDEPPDWFFSVRHHLGAVLVETKRYREAIFIYNEDLKIYRNNGWALRGLMNAYENLGKKKKYDETKALFDKAWEHADIKISSSRIL